jgi:hypothetical protein
MSKWTEKIKEKEGRKGLIPWLSVSIQKGIFIYTAIAIILVIPIYVFAGEYWPGGMIFTILAAIIVYVGFKTSWLKNVERANKLTRFVGAVIVGFGAFGLLLVLLELALCFLLFFLIFKALLSSGKAKGEKVIKQDGRTYRENWTGNWEADKDWTGNDKVERDLLGNPKIETDWKGDQKIETDWKGVPIVPPKKNGK